MTISIDFKKVRGPYGGGNQFVLALESFLLARGHRVIFDLNDHCIDIILMVSPLPGQPSGAYSYLDAAEYSLRHRSTVVIQRVNICAEGRGSGSLDRRLARVNRFSDYTIFVSEWLRDVWQARQMIKSPYAVIKNGADTGIFNPEGRAEWDGQEKMKIITHHWSTNPNKGIDIYLRIDELLAKKSFSDRFQMTYAGNVPRGVDFKHIRVVPPTFGPPLAALLKEHHIYVTGARNEAAGMHNIEAGCVGLPILYRDSGALPEYCAEFGLAINENNIEERLLEMRRQYGRYADKARQFPYNAEHMSEAYLRLFEKLLAQKKISCQSGVPAKDATFYIALFHIHSGQFLNRLSWNSLAGKAVSVIKRFYAKSLHRTLLDKEIVAYAPLIRGETLDIGSKNRRYDDVLSHADNITALDANPYPGLGIIKGDARALPFPAASFDTVVSFEVLEYIMETRSVLCEVKRVLRPGGIFVFSVPFLCPAHEDRDLVRYTEDGWKMLLRTDFDVVNAVRIGGRYGLLWDFFFVRIRNRSGAKIIKALAFPLLSLFKTVALYLDKKSPNDRFYMGNIFVCRVRK